MLISFLCFLSSCRTCTVHCAAAVSFVFFKTSTEIGHLLFALSPISMLKHAVLHLVVQLQAARLLHHLHERIFVLIVAGRRGGAGSVVMTGRRLRHGSAAGEHDNKSVDNRR